MKKKMTAEDLEKKWAEINSRPEEVPSENDLKAFEEADTEAPEDRISLEEYKATREYSGKLMLRIPKDLHKALAEAAKINGVSLNQYAMYKLAR